MNKDFVSFELSKKLKEKGFPLVDYIPTISQVLKWLREEKKIYLELVIVVDAEYMCDIYKIDAKPIECLGSTEYFKNYEQAALAGIEYVINNFV